MSQRYLPNLLLVEVLLMTLITGAHAEAVPQPEGWDGTHTAKDIHIRDPFILPVAAEKRYYLFGTVFDLPNGPGFKVYRSADLKAWHGPKAAFRRPEAWGKTRDFWAPEVFEHGGHYFMFASFLHPERRRGTQILVADEPAGPYRPHSDGPVTPAEWECLDGTLFIDDAKQPWMIFCHEWEEPDGVENNCLAWHGGRWVMLYSASLAEQKIAWAISDDLIRWEKQGLCDVPVFEASARSFGAPFVIEGLSEPGTYHMIYQGRSLDDHMSFLLLESEDLVTWR